MVLERKSPEIGYVDAATAKLFGICPLIRAGDFLHLSGVAPVSNANGSMELISPGNYRAQLIAELDIIERTLKAESATMADVAAITIYALNASDYMENVDVINNAFGENLPTSTLVGVSALVLDEQQVEVTAIAYCPAGNQKIE